MKDEFTDKLEDYLRPYLIVEEDRVGSRTLEIELFRPLYLNLVELENAVWDGTYE
jgi:hypothetical protein